MNTLRAPLIAILFLVCAVATSRCEDKKDESKLSLDRIYRAREFESARFAAKWTEDGAAYLTLEKPAEGKGRDIVQFETASGKKTILVPAAQLTPPGETEPLAIDAFTLSADRSLVLIYTNSKRVWRRNTRGDYWVLDRSNRQLRKLGGDARPATLMFAKFSPDSRRVGYVRERNIYIEDLRDQTISCLTKTPSDEIINGTFDWVYEEELGLRDGFRWSPDGQRIAFWRLDTSGVRRIPLVNNTDSLYPKITWIPYPKVGQQNSAWSIGVVEVNGGLTRWMKTPGDPRQSYLARMEWTRDGNHLVLQQLNRLQNTNRVLLADRASGEVSPIFTERDDAWVNVHDELLWIDDQRFTWVSERDGWRHAYLGELKNDQLQLATPVDFDVARLLHVDKQSGALYFLASPDNPTQRYLYRGLPGGPSKRLTPKNSTGVHAYQISPDSRWAIHSHSSFDSPPVTELVSLPDHKVVRVLSGNSKLREKLAKVSRAPSEFFRVDIGGDVKLDGWCIKPADFDPNKKYPLLMHVYGEPAGQSVIDRWGGSNYLWHQMLAQRGYVIISVENRGTPAPRGRAWRKCVYRQVGILAPKDQAAAVRALLKSRPYLDPERVGVWGWSGGGSMSLNAIFKYPKLYKTAIAVAPVPNQRYYDTIYQERYMGLPNDNAEGFLRGSPINYAHQLEGNLLLIHGTGDDNCHYQTTEMLINELIRHNKRFSMMSYPNRTHSIREGKNTTRHLRTLMTDYLRDHLPPTGK